MTCCYVESFDVLQKLWIDVLGVVSREARDPGVFECLLGRAALRRVELEHLREKLLGVCRDVLPAGEVRVVLAGADFFEDLGVVSAVEGGDACEEDEEDDAAGPDVALFVVATKEDFWGDVVWLLTGGYCAGPGRQLALAVLDRSAEVDDLERGGGARRLEQDVLGLEVAVDDLLFVAVGDSGEDLLHDLGCVLLGEVVRLDDEVEELSACAEFGDDEEVAVVLEVLEDFDDVRVVLR